MPRKFGDRLKELRIEKGLTLREFCGKNGFEPGNYSKVERGLFAPPGDEKVNEYSKALGYDVGSDVNLDLRDLAYVGRGELPADLLSDEQLVNELPALYRTLRGQQIDDEQRQRLLDLLRRR